MNIEEYKNTSDLIAVDLNDSLCMHNIIKTSHLSVELRKLQALRKMIRTMYLINCYQGTISLWRKKYNVFMCYKYALLCFYCSL